MGATDGFTYTEEFWEAKKKGSLSIEVTMRDELNMAKLIRGRIDLFPAEKHLGNSILLSNFQAHSAYQIDFHPKPLLNTTGHLLFSKVHPKAITLTSAFNAGLKELRENGRYEELFDIYIISQP